jgi:hypothetical protein
MSNGKGSRRRPAAISREEEDRRWKATFGQSLTAPFPTGPEAGDLVLISVEGSYDVFIPPPKPKPGGPVLVELERGADTDPETGLKSFWTVSEWRWRQPEPLQRPAEPIQIDPTPRPE